MYGADHESTNGNLRPSETSYTNIVSKHYGIEHKSFAHPGYSNQNIARTVFMAKKYCDDKDMKPIFWLGWTKYVHMGFMSMKSIGRNEGWPFIDVQNEIIKSSKDDELHELSKTIYRSLDKMSRLHLSMNSIIQANLFLHKEGIPAINTFNSSTWIMDCVPETFYVKQHNSGKECLVQDYFDKRKGTISADKLKGEVIAGTSGNSLNRFDPYSNDLWNYMKSFRWFEWGDNDLGFQKWTRDNGFPSYKEPDAHNSTNPTHWHPGEKAHEEAADRIINSNIIGEMLK
tara:strand:- start:849 stop:1706 length:858 start_codon:yes stop_codon:yes gene_type:complete